MNVKEKCLSALKGGGHRWLLLLGALGVALLAIPELIPDRASAPAPAAEVTVTELEAALEQRVAELVSGVSGVGACRVMVTLERGVQTVYAADTSDSSSEGVLNEQRSVLTVDTDSGPVGLPVAQLQPTVKGIAVVCQGGDDPDVCRSVTELLSTALHISDRRVCVAKSAFD